MRVNRFAARLLVLVWLGPAAAYADEPFFPASVFFPNDEDLNTIVVEHFTLQLQALKEPSLWKLSSDYDVITYRFLWLTQNARPTALRISKAGNVFTLHVVQHDGSPGMTPGKVVLSKDVPLSAEQWEGLVHELERAKFWTAPVEVKETRGIADGNRLLVEGARNGKYHVVDRSGFGTPAGYKAFCRTALVLGKVEGLAEWDRIHKDEQKRPGYQANPPETLDLGN